LVVFGVFPPAHALTQQELLAKFEPARVIRKSEISNPPPKARPCKEVTLVVDSGGQIKERK
jgi:hypothetical protein